MTKLQRHEMRFIGGLHEKRMTAKTQLTTLLDLLHLQ